MTWKKCKLGDVIRHRKGFIEIEEEKEYKLCRVQVNRRGVVLREHLTGAQIRTKKQQVCKSGDFLVAEMDAKVGGYGFVPEELNGAIVSSHYFLFELDKTKIRPQYLEVVSQLKILQEQIKAVGSTNYAAIRPANVLNWEIPLPPIEKQIEIEKIFQKAKENVNKLTCEYSFQLTQMQNLTQAILQEAVQGKLVKQNPKDEPASQLLQRIKAEKEKSGKKEKPLPPIQPEEIPFSIPESWVWCRLGEICSKITDGFHNTPPKVSEGFPYIAATHVKSDKIDWDSCHYVSERFHRELYAKTSPKKGELLVVNIGAGCGTPAIIDVDFEFSFKNTAILKFNQKEIQGKYLFYYFLLKKDEFYNELTTGGLQPFLSLKILNNILIPLPSQAEQKRIVTEIENQLAKTQQLKEQVIANQEATEQLLKALLHEAFAVGEK